MTRPRIMIVVGTRPEALKLLPVYDACREHGGLDVSLVATAQHRQMLDQVLDLWGCKPAMDLNVMTQNQTLSDVTSNVLRSMIQAIAELKPQMIVVQGDTITTFAASLAAFFARISVAHVEAGLRTGDKYAPFPEEMSRRLTSVLSEVHFAPTEESRCNLLREGVRPDTVHVTGNTIIDGLLQTVARIESDSGLRATLDERFAFLPKGDRIVLVTAHRRESFGPGMEEICRSLLDITALAPDVRIVYPVHPNPSVRGPVDAIVRNSGLEDRIYLLDPLPYLDFVYLLKRAAIVLTDSGGVQEEAPALGKPVLVMRDVTERPEAVACGSAMLVGASRPRILSAVAELLEGGERYHSMAQARFPYGDGTASRQIADLIHAELTR